MECALTNLQELCLVLQKYSPLFISGRVWTRETSRSSMPCGVSCWNKNEKRPMWDSWVLEMLSCSVFEPALLSAMLYLPPAAVISRAPSRVSQQDRFYQVAANCCVGCRLARFHQLQQGVTLQTAHIHSVPPKDCINIICSSHLPLHPPPRDFSLKQYFICI